MDPLDQLSEAIQFLQETIHSISGAPVVAVVIGREDREALARFKYIVRSSPQFHHCIVPYHAPLVIMELHTTIIMEEPREATPSEHRIFGLYGDVP